MVPARVSNLLTPKEGRLGEKSKKIQSKFHQSPTSLTLLKLESFPTLRITKVGLGQVNSVCGAGNLNITMLDR